MSAVTEPGMSLRGRALLYHARIHHLRHGKPYRLRCADDRCAARNAVRGGYLHRGSGSAADLVTLTPKGESYLDLLMRCE